MPGLSAALAHRQDYLINRQGVISGNIANAATPDYVAKDVTFEKMVTNKQQVAMATTDGQHMAGRRSMMAGQVVENRDNMKHDGNSVKLDEEMLKLNEVQLNHRLVTSLYQKHAEMHRNVVSRP